MSWVDRELKRRTRRAPAPAPGSSAGTGPAEASEPQRIRQLWEAFERANAALPEELRLVPNTAGPAPPGPDGVRIGAMLVGPGGAGLGLAADAIRYLWPKSNPRKSNNFWIRWDAVGQRYTVQRRIGSTMPPTYAQYPFDERRVGRIMKSLVLGRRIDAKSLRKKRFWLF